MRLMNLMRTRVVRLGLLALAMVPAGCALGLPTYNTPFSEKIVVVAPEPGAYQVRIEDSEQPDLAIPADGRVTLEFPVLPRVCSTYLFGIKIKDRSVEARPLVHFIREGRLVKKMSVHQIRRLPVDDLGFHRVRLR